MAVIFTSSSSLSLPAPLLSTATTTTTTLFSSTDSISGNRPTSIISKTLLSSTAKPNNKFTEFAGSNGKWRTRVSFFSSFSKKAEDIEALKEELFGAISPLDRGTEATAEDQKRIDQIARKIEAKNKVKEPLKSDLLNGKWELLYTTSKSILQTQKNSSFSPPKWWAIHGFQESRRPKLLRPNGKIYQAINGDTLRAQNLETWPFFNQATANLVPLDSRRVAVKFDSFKIAGLIPIKARGSGRGQLEITYLDDELRISRGNQGNLFVLRMADPSYRVPLS